MTDISKIPINLDALCGKMVLPNNNKNVYFIFSHKAKLKCYLQKAYKISQY